MRYTHVDVDTYIEAKEWNLHSSKSILKYAVGGLLYTPGNHNNIALDIINKRYTCLKSIAFCLEDAVMDNNMIQVEEQLINTISSIYEACLKGIIETNDIPLIFIRVRSALQMKEVAYKCKDFADIITGFILPKFSQSNAYDYQEELYHINKNQQNKKFYIMPIIESKCAIDIGSRNEMLYTVKSIIDEMKEDVLNVRVGGNDFCNHFGLRRNKDQTIYDMGVIKHALIDILNVFARDYVVSGPVFEYFGQSDSSWIDGFLRELKLDKLNGFTGKTSIHPTQLPYIQKNLMVDYEDYADADSILNWTSETQAVQKSPYSNRMNEKKVHERWAQKIMMLSQIYGVKK